MMKSIILAVSLALVPLVSSVASVGPVFKVNTAGEKSGVLTISNDGPDPAKYLPGRDYNPASRMYGRWSFTQWGDAGLRLPQVWGVVLTNEYHFPMILVSVMNIKDTSSSWRKEPTPLL